MGFAVVWQMRIDSIVPDDGVWSCA